MAKIIDFAGYTSNDLSPDEVLENNKGEFNKLVLIGYDPDGRERFCGTYSDIKDIVFLLERFKLYLLRMVEEE